jgi:hypothetical protein
VDNNQSSNCAFQKTMKVPTWCLCLAPRASLSYSIVSIVEGRGTAGAAHMIKMLLTLAVFGSMGSFADLAMAQDQQAEAFAGEISSQCAHRRVIAPNLRDGCGPKPRSDAQLGYGQGQSGNEQGPLGYWMGQFAYWPGGATQQPDQGEEEQPKAHREQPKSSALPKVTTAPKAKKPSPPPRLAAQNQKEQRLYQEFLEWRNRRLFNEEP